MADPDSGVAWDDTVDVICVGTSPGVLAYAVCCAAHGLDVLLVHPPDGPDEQTAAWYAAMTEDLSPTVNPERESAGEDRQGFSFARVAPMPEPTGKRRSGKVAEPAATPGQTQLAELQQQLRALQGEAPLVPAFVDAQVIAEIVSAWTGIPAAPAWTQ